MIPEEGSNEPSLSWRNFVLPELLEFVGSNDNLEPDTRAAYVSLAGYLLRDNLASEKPDPEKITRLQRTVIYGSMDSNNDVRKAALNSMAVAKCYEFAMPAIAHIQRNDKFVSASINVLSSLDYTSAPEEYIIAVIEQLTPIVFTKKIKESAISALVQIDHPNVLQMLDQNLSSDNLEVHLKSLRGLVMLREKGHLVISNEMLRLTEMSDDTKLYDLIYRFFTIAKENPETFEDYRSVLRDFRNHNPGSNYDSLIQFMGGDLFDG